MTVGGPVPLDSFCGLYCGACEVLRAEADGRVDSVAKMFGVEPGEVHCRGCRSGSVFKNCEDCRMRACASGRGFEFCSECEEFPCGEYRRIASFGERLPPHFLVIMKNLAEIREKGAVEWRQLQIERWTCPSCGAHYAWYTKTCPCGGDVSTRKDWQRLSDEDKAFFQTCETVD